MIYDFIDRNQFEIFFVLVVTLILITFPYIIIKQYKFEKKKNELSYNNEFINKNSDKINILINQVSTYTFRCRMKFVFFGILYLICCLFLLYFCINSNEEIRFPLLSLTPFMTYIFIRIENSVIYKYTSNYKEQVIKKVINNFNSDLEYYPKEGFTKEEYDNCSFRENYDKFYSEDLITYQKDIFRYADISTIDVHRDKDGETDTVTFCGSLASTTIKNINCKILLDASKKEEWYINDEFETIILENDEFNKTYTVSTNNDLIAYKILTPDIMERFIKLQQDTFTTMDIRFINDKIYIRFPNGNNFKPYLWNKSLEKRNIAASIAILQEMIEILGEIRDIIDKKNL